MDPSGKLPYTIGLTGGIGSGKSAVSEIFQELGVPVIDTDQISRELVKKGSENLDLISRKFGREIVLPSGELDRTKLRQIVFADAASLTWLEELLHPQIRAVAMQELAANSQGYAILVVPLLLESRHYDFIDRILVVDCAEEIQIQRVMERDHCSHEEAKLIIESQLGRQQRLSEADDIIDNSTTIKDLTQAVHNLHEKYQALSGN